MQTAIRCSLMRGGSSKGLYFRKEDLPADEALRDRVLVAALGSDARQIDGAGGAHPLEIGGTKEKPTVLKADLLRTARLIMRGELLVPAAVWDGRR
jgi:2-methylaconitate cis-trans-isomerase PrpF